jgi:uncharacterized protein DUF6869
MNEFELERLVEAWIACCEADEGTEEYQRNRWAMSQVLDWEMEGEAENLWAFVLAAYKRNISDEVIAVLAAGPLEDLLSKNGASFIGRVEELASRDEKFRFLLGGVWQNAMPDDIWRRVEAAREERW